MHFYPLFDVFFRRFSLLKLSAEWDSNLGHSVHFFLQNNCQEIPCIEVYIDKELPFTTVDLAQ